MHTFTLEPEQVDAIVIKELASHLEGFKQDYIFRKKGLGISVFDHDIDKDIAMIGKHIESLEMILKYYGGETTQF